MRALPDGIPSEGAIQDNLCEFAHHPEVDGQIATHRNSSPVRRLSERIFDRSDHQRLK
jgi:hypothetical protein